MKAEKKNKVYTITEAQKAAYLADGFDILTDEGEVIAYGKGKTVQYGDYEALVQENEALKAKLAETASEAKTTETASTAKTAASSGKAGKKAGA